MPKRKKGQKRCTMSQKLVGNRDVVLCEYAIDYVKKLGYEVRQGSKYLMPFFIFFFTITLVSSFSLDNPNVPTLNPSTQIDVNVTLTNQSFLSDLYCELVGCQMTGNIQFIGDRGVLFQGSSSYLSDLTGLLNLYSPLNMEIRTDSILTVIGQTLFNNRVNFTDRVFFSKNITAPNICYSDGTNCTVSGSVSTSLNNTQLIRSLLNLTNNNYLLDNFYHCGTSGNIGDTNFIVTVSGAQAPGVTCTGLQNSEGIPTFNSGTTAVGNAYIGKPVTSKFLNIGDIVSFGAYVYNETVRNTTGDYVCSRSVYSISNYSNSNLYGSNAVGFRWSRCGYLFEPDAVSVTNITVYTRVNDTETLYETSKPVLNNTLYDLTFMYLNSTRGVDFYVNNVFVYNISSTLPLNLSMGWNMAFNTSGPVPTNRQLVNGIDYFKYYRISREVLII